MIEKLYKEENNEELFNDYKKADRFMLFVVFIHWIFVSTLSALPYHTYALGIVGGGVLYFITLFAYQFYKGTPIMRIFVAIVLMTYTIISIQQNLGRIEMHFHIFIALAFLTIYKDFIPVAIASIYIALHHLLFTYLQLHNISIFGTPIMLFNYGCGWSITFLHAFYVVFEWIVLTMIIHRSRVAFYDNIKYKSELQDANDNLEHKIQEKLQDIENQKLQLEKLMSLFDKNVIFSRTDLKGNITYASEAFCEISGYTKDELVGQPHNIVRHPDMPSSLFKEVWDSLKKQACVKAEMKNRKKDGGFYWVESKIEPEYDLYGHHIGYTALRVDITDKKEIESLKANLELTIEDRTKELQSEKKLTSSIINSQDSIVVTSDGKKLTTSNKAFDKFYGINGIDEFVEKYGPCICDSFEKDVPDEYLKKDNDGVPWVPYVLQRPDEVHKVIIKKDSVPHIFTIGLDSFEFEGAKFITVVLNDITEVEAAKEEIRLIHKHTKESIEYAALLQGAIVAQEEQLQPYFKDYFVFWEPKDTVGGDIWLFNELKSDNECLLMVIDCTGHGVPGAFVTMIVKAVEKEIVGKILENPALEVSTSWVLSQFNKTIKKLLKQDHYESLSNAGFDGGVIYYNKKDQVLKFSGAQTPLFYIDNDEKMHTIKGSRYSVGYKQCQADYEYNEHIIEVQEGMKFFCTTDGYIDQNGGKNGFPFGKRKFGNLLKENFQKPMSEIKTTLHQEILDYQYTATENERNDDMTVVGFEIPKASARFEPVEILNYEGVITQNVVAISMDNLEAKISNISIVSKIATITIELLQNMMHYSKAREANSDEIIPAGFLEIIQVEENMFEAKSRNIISIDDKNKIEVTLQQIKLLDVSEIKKRYRELRKSGQNTHAKGGGIGFYEIAKLCKAIDYNFVQINERKYDFEFICYIEAKRSKS